VKETFVVGADHAIRPADDAALELVQKFEAGYMILLDLKKSRNPLFHRYAFKMLHHLYDMVDTEWDFEPWRKDLMILAGERVVHGRVSRGGQTDVIVSARSLSWESMPDELEFRRVWNGLIQAFINTHGNIITYDELRHIAGM